MTIKFPAFPAPICAPDLHGHPEFLQMVLDRFPRRHIVCLGDYCDRGPDVPGVLKLLKPLVESGRVTALLGNHDDFFIRILLDGFRVRGWEESYFNATLAQYSSHAAAVEDALWMRDHLMQWHVWQHVYLSHAAPHKAWNPDKEMPEHLWGRPGEGTRSPLPDGCTFAVHGHTPTPTLRQDHQPLPVLLEQMDPDRTSALYLDTAAFHTGVYTVLDLADMQHHAFTRTQAATD
ncbi:metallophosphoesterase (plasmid) [Deinococcus sp. KNUC1210]|uniref:metallophosphoesterase n=1 Tax=Deinococcus sp. KNUC1210 TaxID=2917691 RepID=UPI001EEFC8FF|nr:metallophosphoesterase [Deinococcus sp. KNUC1210]ULH17372.1 metallophosphoesterase [Deinococcus sp. KNUC1210]